jgi:peptidoglycan/xylan/chitin deacetylase (PgdA/CDA1 family)
VTAPFVRRAGQAVGVLATLKKGGLGRGAVVLTYHDVTTDAMYAPEHVSPQELRTQLVTAADVGWEFVDLVELTRRAVGGEEVDGLAAVTFDDAFVGIHRDAAEVLDALGVPATVFAPSARLGVDDPDWYEASDRTMSAHELREVAKAGIRVESHTRTHANLPTLDDTALELELRGAREELEDLLGEPVTLLAYPFGYYDRRVRAATEAAGYDAAYSFLSGRLVPGLDRFRLPRLPMPERSAHRRLLYQLRRPAWSFPDHRQDAVTSAA